MEVRVATSIEAFGSEAWNRLFPGELEGYAYYVAVEKSGLPEFEWLYFGIFEQGTLRAAAPAFITNYELDTTLQGPLRRITAGISRLFPRLLRQRLLALGSPVGEICHLGFAPDCSEADKAAMLAMLLRKVESVAKLRRVGMVAAKDASAAQDALWANVGGRAGLRRQPGLPTALLDIDFSSIDEYLSGLSYATRKDLRRKLKAGSALRVEWRDNIDDIRDEVLRLYRATYENADLTFEELTAEYFSRVLRECAGQARCATYWAGDRLVAFNLVLHDGGRLLDKFLGMDYEVARKYNLYFYTWVENVRYCIAHGIKLYQAGQGLHREKLRLGSRLQANWLWYRHRNPVLDRIFATLERLFRLDRFDADLAALNLPPPQRGQSTSLDASRAPGMATSNPPRSPIWMAWVTLIGCEVLCQIALKLAGKQVGVFDFSPAEFAQALRSPWLWVAIATYIGNFFAWMLILRKSQLSAAFPTSAIVFVGVMFACRFVLDEPITWSMLLGSLIIVIGILLLGGDVDEAQSATAVRPPAGQPRK